jgi:hypothetical protein
MPPCFSWIDVFGHRMPSRLRARVVGDKEWISNDPTAVTMVRTSTTDSAELQHYLSDGTGS